MRITKRIRNSKVRRKVFLLLLPLFVLTACTGKDDIVLEWSGQEIQGKQEPSGSEPDERLIGETPDKQEALEAGSVMEEANATVTEPEECMAPATEIYVHICGAVEEPGVYELAAGSRVFEGVEAAGGFREDACEDFINLALLLQDGQRIVIPTVEEADAAKSDEAYKEKWLSDVGGAGQSTVAPEGADSRREAGFADGGARVDINRASEAELSSIDGIGAGKAAAIVRYRQENGAFATIEDIMNVSGIKEGTFEKIKDKITVN